MLQVSQGTVAKALGDKEVDASGAWQQSVLICTAAVHPGARHSALCFSLVL